MKNILITGISGLIGNILRRHFEKLGGYKISGLNRTPVRGVDIFPADITNLELIKPAFTGKDIVIHLAANITDQDSWESRLSTNIIGTYNVLEAARLAQVKRVIFASSGAVTQGYESIFPYNSIIEGKYDDVPDIYDKVTHNVTWPKGLYGATKVCGEAIGRHFSDFYDMSILCVRIGRVNKANRPESAIDYPRFLSHKDISQFFERCVEAPKNLKYDIFYATSNNKWGYRDLEHPRTVLGYKPIDSAEDFA